MPTTVLKNTAYRLMLPFFAPSCGPHPVASVSGHDITHMRSLVSLLRRHHVLGSSILLADGDHRSIVCTVSDRPKHIAQMDTFFRVASITKTATSVLVMHLADENILDPDRPVADYLNLSGSSDCLGGITLRHLLSHTSGLSDPPSLEASLERELPFTVLLKDARFADPGHSFRYSNLGFGLIGCVLESVLSKPVGEIFRNLLFEPLGMNATLEGCLLPAGRIMPVTRVLPYHKDRDLILTRLGSRPLLTPDPLRHYGHTAGSMYTDIVSLQKLLHVLADNSVKYLSEYSRHEICDCHASYGSASPTLSYGYGLLRISDPFISDHVILGHQGFAYGCADGAFWESHTGRMMIMLNGGSSEARHGRLGLLNRDMLRWAFRKEIPSW